MALIKSHSNYVLKKNHQAISDGTIWERDITTIGGVNQFAPGQIPIYKSSNFIITVRNDGKVANQYNKTKWKENESGDTWTLETISGITSEFEDQNDVKIVLKQDYYDFRDFAYYGSLSEMFRASINDVLSRFPGELYGTNEHVYYTSAATSDFERVEERIILGGEQYFLLSNPFGINVYTEKKPVDGDYLKYFADEGYKNYRVGKPKTDTNSNTNDNTECEGGSGGGSDENLDWENIVSWYVDDAKDPCDVSCKCDKFKVENYDVTFISDGGEMTIGTYKEVPCVTDIGFEYEADWIIEVKEENGAIIAKVKENENTKPDGNRDATIRITANTEDEQGCSHELTIHQNRKKCTCDNFVNVSNNPIKVTWDGNLENTSVNKITAATYAVDGCVNRIEAELIYDIESQEEWLELHHDIDGNVGTIWFSVTENQSKVNTRGATIIITGHTVVESDVEDDCTTSITVSQDRQKCTCEDFRADNLYKDKSIDDTGSTENKIEIAKIWADECIDLSTLGVNITDYGSEEEWIYNTEFTEKEDGYLYLTANFKPTITARTAHYELTVTAPDDVKVNPDDVCHIPFSITQAAKICGCADLTFNEIPEECDCYKFVVTDLEVNVSYNGADQMVAALYSNDGCIEDINAIVDDEFVDWLHVVKVKNGQLFVKVDPTTVNRIGTIKMHGTANGFDCPPEIVTVRQSTRDCKCEDFDYEELIKSIGHEGGTNQMILSFSADTCFDKNTIGVSVTSNHGGESDSRWFHVSVSEINKVNGLYVGTIIANIDETVEYREATYIVSGSSPYMVGNCSSSFTFSQSSKDCGCDELSISEQEAQSNGRGLLRSSVSMLRNSASNNTETKQERYRRVAITTIATENGSIYKIYVYVGDNNEIVYLHKGDLEGIHIRPLENFMVDFYNGCDNFEKLLLNDKSTPKYSSTFSVIKENERGYYREMENFVFPTSYGGYNIDASSYGFNDYTTKLSEIGEYYDEFFTDNLYRSMTHEAIKNFDWTYTREFYQGEDEEFVYGGQKIQKALRIFAREFDEIITYINNIKNLNRVTYDERSNIPDYFLIDVNENNGWDVKLVYPYDLVEYKTDEFGNYIKDSDGNKIEFNSYAEKTQLDGYEGNESKTYFARNFSQNTKKEIYPYSKKYVKEYPNGYFISCCGNKQLCEYNGSKYYVLDATCSGTTYSDSCDGKIKNRIKSYTDERPYTYFDANNEFMRRLAINSPYIWRHKGTIEGVEMILGMFGLKSKRWVDRLTNNCLNNNIVADYEISEYSSFTNRIEEKWDAVHQMYRIDWINSTKAIVYDYRSASNYTKYGTQSNYVSYQGLPVTYRYEEIYEGSEPYIKVSSLSPTTAQETTANKEEAFKKVGELNEPVLRRYLYPNFDKNEQLDGNPYFQMGGGWLSKTISNINGNMYNFQFDVNDNISYTPYVANGSDSNDKIIDNHSIYKETIRNIKRVDTLNDLLSVPVNTLKDGSIYYVSNIENNIAIIDNQVYPIKLEYSNPNSAPFRYISLIKNDNYIKIGDDKFFDKNIIVYDKTGAETSYFLEDKEYGYEVKAYIKPDNSFICKADESGYYTIDSFEIFDTNITDSSTNYFIIDNTYYSDRIDVEGNGVGWRMLYVTDPEYIKINTITNYYEGNNPHNGNMTYDSGHEYFTYFKRLFKHAIDNDLFDERCYESFYNDLDGEISNIGFNNLIHNNEMIIQYEPYLVQNDTKIHYFGTYYKKSNDTIIKCTNVQFYGANKNKISELSKMYKALNSEITVGGYILNNDDKMILGSPYKNQQGTVDEITNQILNNKKFKIKFYLHNSWQSNKGQCELKYLDDIVMNYLSQMIPSTTIIEIQYIGK